MDVPGSRFAVGHIKQAAWGDLVISVTLPPFLSAERN